MMIAGVVLVVGATGGVGVLFSEALPGMLMGTHGGAAAAGAWCFTLSMSSITHAGIDFLKDYFNKPSGPASDQEAKNPKEQERETKEKAPEEPKDVHKLEASQEGMQFIAGQEGFKDTMYKVKGSGRWTIGYGHEFDEKEIPRYKAGITKEEAKELFCQDVQKVIRTIRRNVLVPLTQYQFDALISYVYNTGSLRKTKLLNNLNAGKFEAAAREMDIVTQTVGEKKVILKGLVRRRKEERKLFLKGDYGELLEL